MLAVPGELLSASVSLCAKPGAAGWPWRLLPGPLPQTLCHPPCVQGFVVQSCCWALRGLLCGAESQLALAALVQSLGLLWPPQRERRPSPRAITSLPSSFFFLKHFLVCFVPAAHSLAASSPLALGTLLCPQQLHFLNHPGLFGDQIFPWWWLKSLDLPSPEQQPFANQTVNRRAGQGCASRNTP